MIQLQILRKMSGEDRLKQAIELFETARELSIANIRKNLGSKVSNQKILQKLRERIGYGTERNTSFNF